MCPEGILRRFAGVFVVVSVVLGWLVHPAWFLFTAFVGLNLFQSGITQWCLLERILGRFRLFGCRPAKECRAVVRQ
jgi:hypothetical protein